MGSLSERESLTREDTVLYRLGHGKKKKGGFYQKVYHYNVRAFVVGLDEISLDSLSREKTGLNLAGLMSKRTT